jgi:hypothetical protein
MARAEHDVSLVLRELKEGNCIPEPVARQSVGAQHGIQEGDRQGGAIGPHGVALGPRLPFDLIKCVQRPISLLFQELGPSVQALSPRHCRGSDDPLEIRNATEFEQGPVFHGLSPLRKSSFDHPPAHKLNHELDGKFDEEPPI